MSNPFRATRDTLPCRRGAHFEAGQIGPSIALHSITGEIDAANATAVSQFVEANLGGAGRLILDLRGLTFCGTHGFSAIHRVNVISSRQATSLAILAGDEVDRILRICDPGGGLPVVRTLEAAISAVASPASPHLRLVAGD
ncbi:STAS domain-containing protein [Mycolicibacterium sediminis]|uniref:Sulfate transporter n=1 Tax=Mycolicibacterium sediminis TaxID=1286180 RepID=A0A7I7QZF1_9MYCO|nr:STAS domain-containing protein [Mycolicibacterium sediminis]BBY31665.1 sulfate transporter [Mycolicibacterium sediminis]